MQENVSGGNVTIENRKNIKISGVSAVNGFSSTQISLTLSGVKMLITGSDLKISDFSKDSGNFSASGLISCVKYSERGEKLKIFK